MSWKKKKAECGEGPEAPKQAQVQLQSTGNSVSIMGLTATWEETAFEREHLIVGTRLRQHFLCAQSATIIPTSQMNKVKHREVKQNALTPFPEITIFRMTSQFFCLISLSAVALTSGHSAVQLSKHVPGSKYAQVSMWSERRGVVPTARNP